MLDRISRGKLFAIFVSFAMACLGSAHAQMPSATARAQIAPLGKLRVAFPLNALTAPKNATTGALEGLIADLGRELAERLGVPVEQVEFATPGKFVEVAAPTMTGSPEASRATARPMSIPFPPR